jgi:hypothetical protein
MTAAVTQAWVWAKAGDLANAERRVTELPRRELLRMPAQRGDLGVLCMLAETLHALADRDGAARLSEQLTAFATLNAVGPTCEYRGAVAHYLGLLSVVLGKRTEAESYFGCAEALNRQLRMPLQLPRTQAQRRANHG